MNKMTRGSSANDWLKTGLVGVRGSGSKVTKHLSSLLKRPCLYREGRGGEGRGGEGRGGEGRGGEGRGGEGRGGGGGERSFRDSNPTLTECLIADLNDMSARHTPQTGIDLVYPILHHTTPEPHD